MTSPGDGRGRPDGGATDATAGAAPGQATAVARVADWLGDYIQALSDLTDPDAPPVRAGLERVLASAASSDAWVGPRWSAHDTVAPPPQQVSSDASCWSRWLPSSSSRWADSTPM